MVEGEQQCQLRPRASAFAACSRRPCSNMLCMEFDEQWEEETTANAARPASVLPLMVPHYPSQTCIVGGYKIPKGARVFINVWAIQRDPSIWENPLEFCPERFIDGGRGYGGTDFNYFPFGSGRRMCAGIAMAERMFLFSLASLLQSFDWKLPEGERLDLSEKFGIVLKKRVPLMAIPTPRLSNPALYE